MPTPDSAGTLSLVWLRRGSPPSMGVVGDVRAVGDAVLEVTGIDSVRRMWLGELSDGPAEVEATFRTLTPVRLTRRIGEKDVDVLVPREELIMNGLIREWISIAATDDSAPPMTDDVARHLVAGVGLSEHRGLHVVSRVVKRDDRTGAPHHRRAFTGGWSLRLVAGSAEQRRWFAATMRLASITGVGRDHTIGGGRVLVQLPPRSPDRSNPHRRTSAGDAQANPTHPRNPTRTA